MDPNNTGANADEPSNKQPKPPSGHEGDNVDEGEPTRTMCGPTNFWNTLHVLVAILLGLSGCSAYYGYTAYQDILLHDFYPDESWSMKNGSPIYVGGFGIMFGTFCMPYIQPFAKRRGRRLPAIIGGMVMVIGFVLSGLATKFKMIWLLWIGFGVFVGFGATVPYIIGLMLAAEYFAQFGKPGLGSAYGGFIAGLWAALYAYIAIDNNADIGFYCTAGMVLVLVVFTSIVWPTMWSSPKAKGAPRPPKNNAPAPPCPESEPFELTDSQIFKLPQFWSQFVGNFLLLMPGFGVKLTIFPLMTAVFQASLSTQQISAAAFLFVYAFTRLLVGFTIDIISQNRWWLITIVVQVTSCIVLGFLVWYPVSQVAFICVEMLLGFSLSATKTLFITSTGYLYGGINRNRTFAMMAPCFGMAAMLGPVSIWAAISQFDMVGAKLVEGAAKQTPAERAIAMWYWCSAGVSVVAGSGLLYFFRPVDFRKLRAKYGMLPEINSGERGDSPESK